MQILTISLKPYKRFYFRALLICVMMVIGSYILVNNGWVILEVFDPARKLTSPILGGMVLIALANSFYQQKKLKQLNVLKDFDEKVAAYQILYKNKIYWYVLSCLVSCGLFIVTGRMFFLYFAIFEIVIFLPLYPNPFVFKKELQNEDIVFIK